MIIHLSYCIFVWLMNTAILKLKVVTIPFTPNFSVEFN